MKLLPKRGPGVTTRPTELAESTIESTSAHVMGETRRLLMRGPTLRIDGMIYNDGIYRLRWAEGQQWGWVIQTKSWERYCAAVIAALEATKENRVAQERKSVIKSETHGNEQVNPTPALAV